jgi:hypothetical protein
MISITLATPSPAIWPARPGVTTRNCHTLVMDKKKDGILKHLSFFTGRRFYTVRLKETERRFIFFIFSS